MAKNQKTDLHEVISNLEHRDKIDTEREDSPLKKADDVILLDNTHFDIEQQFKVAMQYIYGVIH